MSGYQADIGQGFWGCLYDESRRNKVLEPAADAAVKAIHKGAWNQYVVDAKGDHVRLFLNGARSVDYTEDEKTLARSGQIAVQIHAGGPMKVEFKNVSIQPLPTPDEKGDAYPGFHLWTLRGDTSGRKFTVYVPRGYDGKQSFPVVLFLHGSGERGTDGVVPAQVGLGPAVYNSPDTFPAIAVFPQARTTWRADSDDAKAALAALDQVLDTLKADRNKVVVTGLSMGGAGSWGVAAANPDRFAAVVPVCGRGSTSSAATLAKLPVWTFCGDADRDETVLNGRAMVEALRAAGGTARLTEYRDVPHNSWDRAYGDPRLIEWMLAQARK
jgi:acetyl esterase/lipase